MREPIKHTEVWKLIDAIVEDRPWSLLALFPFGLPVVRIAHEKLGYSDVDISFFTESGVAECRRQLDEVFQARLEEGGWES